MEVQKNQNSHFQKILSILTSYRIHRVLAVLFIFYLLMIVPEKTTHHQRPEFIQTVKLQPKLLPYAKDELIDFDFPPRPGKPLEIPTEPQDLNSFQLLQSVGHLHQSYFDKKRDQHINESMYRIFMMFMQFESISRLRFNRGTVRLKSQSNLEELADHIMDSKWYRIALQRFSSNSGYGFSEQRMLRILISIQAAAHFFEVPYPALFCLFFQESKFDFLADSATGAKGIGQLTSIGLREIRRLRQSSKIEIKLQKTAAYLNQVYSDTQIQQWLSYLGLNIYFPEISPIPEKIEFTRISSAFMREVGKELVKEGQTYGNNTSLLWILSKRLRRGRILPSRFAHMHKIFSQMLEDRYASSPASTYNIETNILLSTILFNHYYRFRWRTNKYIFNLLPQTRVILAAAAYNHGQSGVRRFLINLKHEFPKLDFDVLSSRKLRLLLSRSRLRQALLSKSCKIEEALRHFNNFMDCAENRTVSPRVL